MDKKTIRDLDVAGQKVLVRVDFNVPFDDAGNISDDTRIRASLDTIKYLLDNDAAVICMAHLGRPKGEEKSRLYSKNKDPDGILPAIPKQQRACQSYDVVSRYRSHHRRDS